MTTKRVVVVAGLSSQMRLVAEAGAAKILLRRVPSTSSERGAKTQKKTRQGQGLPPNSATNLRRSRQSMVDALAPKLGQHQAVLTIIIIIINYKAPIRHSITISLNRSNNSCHNRLHNSTIIITTRQLATQAARQRSEASTKCQFISLKSSPAAATATIIRLSTSSWLTPTVSSKQLYSRQATAVLTALLV